MIFPICEKCGEHLRYQGNAWQNKTEMDKWKCPYCGTIELTKYEEN